MPHAHLTGTAWDKSLDDYAYTPDLDRPGWAWEFLRRNAVFRRDAKMGRISSPRPIRHASGATYFRCRRRFLMAEKWKLQFFPDPQKSACDTHVFWLPKPLRKHLCATLIANESDCEKSFSLSDFQVERAVFCGVNTEQIIIRHGPESVRLSAKGLSILLGQRRATFEVEGYQDPSNAIACLQSLARLARFDKPRAINVEGSATKWRDYLIALDGHLEGRTYRDIAEVIYGAERIGTSWTDENRSLKDRVRRAVERGIELMQTGYVELL
jgi:hypothetical protein